MDKKTRIIVSLVSVAILCLGTLIGILLVQGYTLDTKTKKVVQTGVLVVNSVPNGAQIFIDDHYQDITNTSISFLPSKKYKIRLTKEGYIPWEKEMEIDNKIISEIEAILWPAIPSVNPITNTGAVNVKVSPDGLKVAYGIKFSEKDKAGIWVLDMAKRTVFAGTSSDFTQIAKNTNSLDFSNAQYVWSPDSKQILVTLQENNNQEARAQRNYVLDITRLNTNPSDITLTKEGVLQSWLEDVNKRDETRFLKIAADPVASQLASSSAIPVRWSWDNTMFLYAQSSGNVTPPNASSKPRIIPISSPKVATSSAIKEQAESTASGQLYRTHIESQNASFSADLNIKIYDTKTKKSFDMPRAEHYLWYPAEEKADREIQHLIMIDDGSISIIESDGKNKSTLYSGPFVDGTVFPWPDGGRLVFMTNFNSGAGSEANLYTINLR